MEFSLVYLCLQSVNQDNWDLPNYKLVPYRRLLKISSTMVFSSRDYCNPFDKIDMSKIE